MAWVMAWRGRTGSPRSSSAPQARSPATLHAAHPVHVCISLRYLVPSDVLGLVRRCRAYPPRTGRAGTRRPSRSRSARDSPPPRPAALACLPPANHRVRRYRPSLGVRCLRQTQAVAGRTAGAEEEGGVVVVVGGGVELHDVLLAESGDAERLTHAR